MHRYRVFVPIFQRVLDTWERGFKEEAAEISIPVRRMRRDLGVTDDEVANWANEIARATLSPDAVLEFRRRINGALSLFGNLAEETVRLGLAVTPRTWITVWNSGVDDIQVSAALKLAMTDADDALSRRVRLIGG